MAQRRNTIIESMGVYLPSRAVSSDEILQGCRYRILFPLEQLTGIRSRRVADEGDFAIDLAKKAIETCLINSKYGPKDVDLLISCSISRYDAPKSFSFEPSTSIKLRDHFGFTNALTFDIQNACAGVFTAIYIIDSFLKTGLIRRGMIVSGEYTTHVTGTAQKEVKGFKDPRLACLTLGDAAAAIILELGPDDIAGFHAMDIYSLGSYSSLCIAKPTDRAHGGYIILTDALKLSTVAIQQATADAVEVQRRAGWPSHLMDYLIMHQTSERTIDDAIQRVNRIYKEKIVHEGNVVRNVAERGNTATTTHWVAINDYALANRLQSGDTVLFSVNGSGLTIGTAAYKFDDLPDRLRRQARNGRPDPQARTSAGAPPPVVSAPPRARIESVGTIPEWWPARRETLELTRIAAENCLEVSAYDRADVDLLIYAGVYRTEFLIEPAMAAMVAGQLRMNDTIESAPGKRTLAFDVMNGGVGFLNACHMATQMIQTGRFRRAMIVASEVENNAYLPGKTLVGLKETGSAVILDNRTDGKVGFGPFVFRAYTEHLAAVEAHADVSTGEAFLAYRCDPAAAEHYLSCIADTVHELLSLAGLSPSQVKVVFPPQISSAFIDELSRRIGIDRPAFIDIAEEGKDYFTSSVPYAFEFARERDLVRAGDVGLITCVGAGIQVGCALYYF